MFEQKTRGASRMIWTVMGLAAFGGTAALLFGFNPQPDPPAAFGIATIVPGETMRVNVVNIADTGGLAPPCRVQMTFVNTVGEVVKSANATIAAGHTGWAAVDFNEGGIPQLGIGESRLRQSLRPVVNVIPPNSCRAIMSAEVYENATGRTNQYIPPIILPPAAATTVPGPQ
jgi:hypothetical protein